MTSDPSYSYTWNAENELKSFGGSYDYTYDGDGKRVENSYNGYYYWYSPDGLPLAETNSSGTTQNEYVYFNGARVARRDSSGNVYYYFSNQIGSTNLMTNSSGTVCYDADRTPFGYEMAYTTTCSQDYNYAGMELDGGTGNYHTWFRNYEPNLGRWMSPDPLGLAVADPTNPQSFNLYAYVLNDPTTLSDPLGLCDCEGGGFGFLGGGCRGGGGFGSGRRFPWGPMPPINPPGAPQPVPGGGGGTDPDTPGSGSTHGGQSFSMPAGCEYALTIPWDVVFKIGGETKTGVLDLGAVINTNLATGEQTWDENATVSGVGVEATLPTSQIGTDTPTTKQVKLGPWTWSSRGGWDFSLEKWIFPKSIGGALGIGLGIDWNPIKWQKVKDYCGF